MSKITLTDDSGTAQDIALPSGIMLTIEPTPVAPPPPPEVTYALELSADKDVSALKAGDIFTLTAVMRGSDGSTKPVIRCAAIRPPATTWPAPRPSWTAPANSCSAAR